MNGILQASKHQTQQWAKQDHVLTAHRWSKLLDNENRWAVYPNVPKKLFQFPLWDPEWQNEHGQ